MVELIIILQILGVGMSEKMWEVTVKHATKCVMGNKMYIFRGPHFELFFTPICQLMKAVINGQTFPTRDISNYNKVRVYEIINHVHI